MKIVGSHEDVQGPARGGEAAREGRHRAEGAQVHLHHVDSRFWVLPQQALLHLGASLRRPGGDDDSGPSQGQNPRRLLPDAARPPCPNPQRRGIFHH